MDFVVIWIKDLPLDTAPSYLWFFFFFDVLTNSLKDGIVYTVYGARYSVQYFTMIQTTRHLYVYIQLEQKYV